MLVNILLHQVKKAIFYSHTQVMILQRAVLPESLTATLNLTFLKPGLPPQTHWGGWRGNPEPLGAYWQIYFRIAPKSCGEENPGLMVC